MNTQPQIERSGITTRLKGLSSRDLRIKLKNTGIYIAYSVMMGSSEESNRTGPNQLVRLAP